MSAIDSILKKNEIDFAVGTKENRLVAYTLITTQICSYVKCNHL